MRILALCALFAAAAAATYVPYDPELNHYWDQFKKVFNKVYDPREELARRLIWEQHIAEIVRHNLNADLGFVSYRRGMNKFSDLNKEEFNKMMNGFKGASQFTGNFTTWLPPMNVNLPDKLDWRDQGLVTEVKNQGACGSCWAFSATGSLEGQHKKKTGKLVSLSEQNLVDCSRAEGNEGCNGGWMDQAFDYIKKNHGIDTEKSYPYKMKEEKCHFDKSHIGATCTGFVDIPSGDEEALKQAVGTVGPISIAINAAGDFQDYESGIYDPEECPNKITDLTHGVLVVGYGSENKKDYWIVKNSWEADWGEKGYIRMARNRNNLCGIATKASYPLV